MKGMKLLFLRKTVLVLASLSAIVTSVGACSSGALVIGNDDEALKNGKKPSCPQIQQPGPSFCPNGTVKPRVDGNGCTVGFDCIGGDQDGGPATNDCVAAGGTCVGLAPNNCAQDRWGDANTFSCGGGVGVGCCLPTCPHIQPPGPSFCPNGTIKPRINKIGCTVGYDCETGALDAGPPNTCVLAGGKCVSISPQSCPNGQFGSPQIYSCGGGVGVGCCLP